MKSILLFGKTFLSMLVIALVMMGCEKEAFSPSTPAVSAEELAFRAPEDNPPETITPPPVRVTVPEGATTEAILDTLKAALGRAEKSATNPQVKAAYRNLSQSLTKAYVEGIKVELEEMDGVAFSYFHIGVSSGHLVIVGISVQVMNPTLPHNQALLEAHENGHSLITREITTRCAAKAVQDAKNAGLKGKALRDAVGAKMAELDAKAQENYDNRTGHGTIGTVAEQGQWAQEEADKVITAYLNS